MRSNPSPVQIHPWTFPARPWSHIHADFTGPISGSTYLVIVDAYSKFPKVVKMSTTSAKATVTTLRDIFSRHGLPEIIVSDNGPQFTATEFEQFCTSNGLLHRTSAVYKPSTNGQAEHVVQILKSAIKQAHLTNADVATVIANHLLVYQTTPHSNTGEPPSLLLIGRRLRNRLGLPTPSLETYIEACQYSTLVSRTAHTGLRTFNASDSVLARNFGRGGKWVREVVTEVLGSRHYIVKVAGNLWKRHIDQLLRRPTDVASTRGFSASNYQSMPLDVSPDMDQPYEIVPDSTIPSTYIPPTATLDESILVSTGDSPIPNKQPTVSMPVTDPPRDFSTCYLARYLARDF